MAGWPPLGELPAGVRSHVVRLTAEVLAEVPGLPAPLRHVAGFVPARRARLGAAVIEPALAADDLRTSVGVQVRARRPDLGAALDTTVATASAASGAEHRGDVVGPDVEAGVVALAWLVRPPGAEAVLAAALARASAPGDVAASPAEAVELRERIAVLEQGAREVKERHRRRLDEARAENATLRQRLGEARAQVRATQQELEELREAAGQLADTAEHDLAAARAQLRRLRSQVDELEARAGTETRERRAERDRGAVRARLLLDALTEAADGLRRELALPPVEGVPADAVSTGRLVDDGVSATSRAGVLGPASPELLEHLLAMPRARLLVDGYNVSRSAWPTSPLEAQRIRLAGLVGSLVARTGAETTVVFDAQHTSEPPPTQVPRGVRVVFSPYGVVADDVIVEYVEAEPPGRVVVVVTDDAELARRVARGGARVVRVAALLGMFGH